MLLLMEFACVREKSSRVHPPSVCFLSLKMEAQQPFGSQEATRPRMKKFIRWRWQGGSKENAWILDDITDPMPATVSFGISCYVKKINSVYISQCWLDFLLLAAEYTLIDLVHLLPVLIGPCVFFWRTNYLIHYFMISAIICLMFLSPTRF